MRTTAIRTVEQQGSRSDVIVVFPRPTGFYVRRGKRVLDLAVSVLSIVVLLPAFAVLGLALRFSLGKGIFFRQERVGLNGHTFSILKYRTMAHDRRVATQAFDGDERRVVHKSDNDPRHTRVGRLLRRFSLDELPQLFNVVKGDMSLVGPRPELVSVATPDFVEHPRHWVRPGLTGPFQLSKHRHSGDLTKGLRLDAAYVGDLSLSTDLGYLLRTVWTVAKGQGS